MKIRYLFTLLLGLFIIEAYSFYEEPGLVFKQNMGQYPKHVLFAADQSHGTIYITSNSVVFNQCEPNQDSHGHGNSTNQNIQECHATSIQFSELNELFYISTLKPVNTLHHYITGKGTVNNVKGFREVILHNIQEGLSIRFFSSGMNFKYDLIIENTLDLNTFKLHYEGFDSTVVGGENLVHYTTMGRWEEHYPSIYVENKFGEKCLTEVDVSFQQNDLRYQYNGVIEEMEKLVVDPILIFSTFSGSTADNWGSTATYDLHGNLFSGGIASNYLGGNFPITTGAYQQLNGGNWDVAITKYDSTGTRPIYSTYLGGSNSEMAQSLVVNSKNELVILGVTASADFPVKELSFDRTFNGGSNITPLSGVQMTTGSDLFISILSEDGSELLHSTFYGGSGLDGVTYSSDSLVKNYGDESRGDVFIDDYDNIYIASRTNSTDFPLLNAAQIELSGAMDGVAVKFTPDLKAIYWSTYIGGSGSDACYSIKMNSLGNVVIGGGTASDDMPDFFSNQFSGNVDGWIAVFEPVQFGYVPLNAVYLGTSEIDQAYFVDLDSDDNIFAFGLTNGDYPVQGDVFSEGGGQFIHKFSPDLTASLVSTNFGNVTAEPDISPTAFLVNDCSNIYLSGWGGGVNSFNTNYFQGSTLGLPITTNAYQAVSTGNDFYLAVFVDNMQNLLYSTFLGGGENYTHVDGGTSRFNKRGIVYHAVCAGCALGGEPNSDFPTTIGAWSNTNNSNNCNNAAFKFDLSSLDAGITTYDESLQFENLRDFCIPEKIWFVNSSIGGYTFEWDFGDGRRVITTSDEPILHEYTDVGSYLVKLRIIDKSTCVEEDETSIIVDIYSYEFTGTEDQVICEGDEVILSSTGGTSYLWTLEDSTIVSQQPQFTVKPDSSITYYLQAERGICDFYDTVKIEVVKRPEANLQYKLSCLDAMSVQISSQISNKTDFKWDMGDGTILEDSVFVYKYKVEGDYNIRLIYVNDFCEYENIIPVSVRNTVVPNVITPGNPDGSNDFFVLKGLDSVSLKIYNRWGREVYHSDNYNHDWSAEGLHAGTYYYYIEKEYSDPCKGWVTVLK